MLPMEKWITSVGIDLGTSTTKWIKSGLKVEITSGGFSLPRFEITERRVEYSSPIYKTPLLSDTEIDMEEVSRLLEEEYRHAGITPADVDTGAVIITGETATKRNSEQLAHALAAKAGQFVVAAAGADLESLLSGKGSGAEAYSRNHPGKIVANMDIGGGTANVSYWQHGRMIATITLHVGGRLLRINSDNQVEYAASPLVQWANRHARLVLPDIGEYVEYERLKQVCDELVTDLIDCVREYDRIQHEPRLEPLLVDKPAGHLPTPDEIWISGGIGSLMTVSRPSTITEATVYGDIGPLLASALRETAAMNSVSLRPADQTSRATVIGAGTQTTAISGATLYYDAEVLPLRNIPVVTCPLPEIIPQGDMAYHASIGSAVRRAVSLYGTVTSDPPFALSLQYHGVMTFEAIQRLADAIAAQYIRHVPNATRLYINCECDMAKALGHSLKRKLRDGILLLCTDQIRPRDGDYIDVGNPLQADVVPVAMKSLIFPNP